MFLRHQFIRPAQYDLRRHVPALLPTQRAGYFYGMEWELPRPGGNIPVTVFAGDDELLAFLHHEPHERIVMSEIID